MKKTLKKLFIPLSLVTLVFVLGLFFGLGSWNKNLYVQWNPFQERGLAGVGSSPKILNLSSRHLTQRADQALFSQSEVVKKERLMAFYLGNLLISDSNLNEHQFICEVFSEVEFSFSAIGTNINGESLMVIQSPCNMEKEDMIGPFWLPYKDILEKPSERSFELPEQETYIGFYNASTVLTSSWLLTNVKFFNESGEESENEGESENQTKNEFLVHFVQGSEHSFELNLRNEGENPPQEISLPAEAK